MSKDSLQTKVKFLTWSNEHIARNIEFNDNGTMKHVLKTIKPVDAVTSIKQSPVLKGHLFLILLQKISYEFNLF